jgi:hypothetical protein
MNINYHNFPKMSHTSVNGAKSLKKILDEFKQTTKNISQEFNNDLKQPLACVEENGTFLGSRKFNVTMCNVSHNDVVHSETVLPQCSGFLQAKQVVDDNLMLLENIRRMLVTNKQQRNVMVKKIKTRHRSGKTGKINDLKKAHEITEQGGGAAVVVEELGIEDETHEDKETKSLIRQIQQNHRTTAHNLCKQADLIVCALRTRDILAYKLAAENTIQKIIRHADLCRKFIEKCRSIARIEYCASAWWMETQRAQDDHAAYYLTAVEEGKPTEFNASAEEYSALVSGRHAPPRILIQVQSQQRSSDDNSCPIVFSQYLDKELADKILTEEAVRAFEADEAPTNYYREYGTIRSISRAADENVQPSFDPSWSAWSAC